MRSKDVKNIEQAMLRITECNLETVLRMACSKNRDELQYRRQIGIVQMSVDWLREFGVDMSNTKMNGVGKSIYKKVCAIEKERDRRDGWIDYVYQIKWDWK